MLSQKQLQYKICVTWMAETSRSSMSPKLSTRNQQNDVCATKNTPTVKTHAPLKRNTCSSIGDRKAQRLTNRKAPCNIKLVLPESPKNATTCAPNCTASHAATSVHIEHENVDLASEWHLNLDKDPRVGEHHTAQQDSLLT